MTTAVLPRHLAIIMDGNGRFAQQQGMPRLAGHEAGVKTLRHIIQTVARLPIAYLTVFAFGQENWQRPASEVDALQHLFELCLQQETQALHDNNVRLRFIGDDRDFTPTLQAAMQATQTLTVNNTGLQFVIAMNYSGRWDICQAVTRCLQEKKLAAVTETEFSNYLATASMPDPDLLIRTSGEQRLSNFLLWQLAYTEFYFCDKPWPAFTTADLEQALADFAKRKRRFGKIEE